MQTQTTHSQVDCTVVSLVFGLFFVFVTTDQPHNSKTYQFYFYLFSSLAPSWCLCSLMPQAPLPHRLVFISFLNFYHAQYQEALAIPQSQVDYTGVWLLFDLCDVQCCCWWHTDRLIVISVFFGSFVQLLQIDVTMQGAIVGCHSQCWCHTYSLIFCVVFHLWLATKLWHNATWPPGWSFDLLVTPTHCHYNAKSSCNMTVIDATKTHWLIVVLVFFGACKVPQKSCQSGLIFPAAHIHKK